MASHPKRGRLSVNQICNHVLMWARKSSLLQNAAALADSAALHRCITSLPLRHSVIMMSSNGHSSGERSGNFLFWHLNSRQCSVVAKEQQWTKEDVGNCSHQRRAPLLDKFGRVHNYLRISLTEKCNLRCQYCMPVEGVQLTPQSKLLRPVETVQLAKLFVHKFGINKIRLTGGEPLLQPQIVPIIRSLDDLRGDGLESIGITSNGIGLKPKLKDLKLSGVDRINISLDTLHEQKYSFITRRKGLKLVWQSIREAIRLQMFPLKINCVAMRGFNDDEIVDFVELTRTYPIDVRFIEYMPFSGNRWLSRKLLSKNEMLKEINKHFDTIVRLNNEKNDTAKSYKVDGFVGTFGFISSMTDHFCAGCNRIRLTADGYLKVCLFDTNEVNLLKLLRNEGCPSKAEVVELLIEQTVRDAVSKKFFSHGGRTEKGSPGAALSEGNRSMITIGG